MGDSQVTEYMPTPAVGPNPDPGISAPFFHNTGTTLLKFTCAEVPSNRINRIEDSRSVTAMLVAELDLIKPIPIPSHPRLDGLPDYMKQQAWENSQKFAYASEPKETVPAVIPPAPSAAEGTTSTVITEGDTKPDSAVKEPAEGNYMNIV